MDSQFSRIRRKVLIKILSRIRIIAFISLLRDQRNFFFLSLPRRKRRLKNVEIQQECCENGRRGGMRDRRSGNGKENSGKKCNEIFLRRIKLSIVNSGMLSRQMAWNVFKSQKAIQREI